MVGGLATVLHGYAGFTADADLVVDLADVVSSAAWKTVT